MPLKIILSSWILLFSINATFADDATLEDYEKRLERYDLEAEPKKHQTLASWCKRNYPAKYNFHLRAYRKYQFSEFEGKIGDNPSLRELKEARDYAQKLELFSAAEDYHIKWGEKQYAAYAKMMKPGDVKMMKQLLTWAGKEGLVEIPSAQKLAKSIIEAEPDHEEARKALGYFTYNGGWTSKETLIEKMDPKNLKDRIETHKILAEARNSREKSYPSRPTSGMESVESWYQFSPRKSPNAIFYLQESGYSRTKPSRLVISLHGGGSGGFEKASEQAGIAMKSWGRTSVGEPQVLLAPIATNHVVSSWSDQSNLMEIINAAEEVCERFNIDRKKIYVTGQSMGGGGTTFWYLCFPELAAASVARTGWFHHDDNKHQDCLQKPILLLQGETDEGFRIESKDKFMELSKRINANASVKVFPGIGHELSWADQEEDVVEFMEKHTNDIEPDWDVIRAAAKAWTK